MKILIIQEKGRNVDNLQYREALNLHRSLGKLDVDSVVWGLNYDNFSTPFEEISKDCDAIVLLENYEVNNWVPNLSNFKGIKLFWSIDSHCIPQQHTNTCDKHNIDIVLNAVYGDEKHFQQKCIYFPNAYPDDLIYPMGIEKTIDVGFCGNWLNRKQWVDWIENNGISVKKDIFVIGNEMVKAINSFKIHFNRNITHDINYRTFETLGCKTLLLTNYTPGLETLFTIGKNIVVYDGELDLIDKIKYYLENDKEREEMAQRGYDHVKANHTFLNRAEQLMKIINENNEYIK
jgi:hypothetical protein